METNTEDRDDDSCDCCGQCNPQVFTSVLLGALACVLVTGGVFLAFHKWDLMWLMVSGVGIVLIVIGAGLHYCGNKNDESHRKRKLSKQRPVNEQSLREQLLPSAPLSNACSISQLSLNMLPPYFPAYGSVSSPQNPQPIGAHNISQIMQINGQSFLVLPIPGEGSAADTQSLAARLSMVFPPDQPSEQHQEIRNGENITADGGSTSQCTGDSGCQTDSTTVSQVSLSTSSPPLAVSNGYQTSELLPTKKDAELQTSCPSTPQVHSLHLQVKDTHETTASTSGKAPHTIQSTVPSTNLVTLDNTSQTEHSSASENTSQNLISNTEESNQAQPLITLAPHVEEISFTEMNNSPHQTESATPNDIHPEDSATEVTGTSALCDVQAQVSTPTHNIQSSVCDISEEIQRNSVLSVPELSAPIVAEEHHSSEPDEISSSNDCLINGNSSLEVNAEAGPSRSDESAHLTLLDIPDNETPLPSDQDDDLDICGRSSPPPSYDEVTQEIQQSIGAYGLAYGTI